MVLQKKGRTNSVRKNNIHNACSINSNIINYNFSSTNEINEYKKDIWHYSHHISNNHIYHFSNIDLESCVESSFISLIFVSGSLWYKDSLISLINFKSTFGKCNINLLQEL